jgi:predicted alpha/beta-fold hydrolase
MPTPTLLVQALDDPFVFRHSLPEPGELSDSTRFDFQAQGGHVGFVGGTIRTPTYYLEQRIPEWLVEVHGA